MTTTLRVTGMTCGHCVSAVTQELEALPGVDGVSVDLVPEGESTVRLTTSAPVSDDDVRTALDEAGDYRLVAAEQS
jgi:copper chaperone